MLRRLVTFVLAFGLACSLESPRTQTAPPAEERACVEPPLVEGVVVHDPHFVTPVHTPHAARLARMLVAQGHVVAEKAPLAILEHRGRETVLTAPRAGVVVHVGAVEGASLRGDDVPFLLSPVDKKLVRVDVARTGGAWLVDGHTLHEVPRPTQQTLLTLPPSLDPPLGARLSLRPSTARCPTG